MKTKLCVICSDEFIPLTGSNRKCCSNKCSATSRANTNMCKYGCRTPSKREDIISRRISEHKKLTKELALLDVYTKVNTVKLLNSPKYIYKKYFGKAKNRTMIKDDPRLYKSLVHWSDIIIGDLSNRKPLSLRLYIMGEYKGIINDDMTCHCGNRLNFDPALQTFSKQFCSTCKNEEISMENFEQAYGVDWFDRYKIYKAARYDAYFKAMDSRHIKAPIGINETKILDTKAASDNCKIIRSRRILNYIVDGYCEETNTIYEVYEYHHKKHKGRDKKRLQNIIAEMNCNVEIIFDGWSGYDDWY
jgi:hypothetical protein